MIILDTNNLIVAAAAEATKEFGTDTKVSDIRNYFMATILNIRKKFTAEYGIELVLAFDGKKDELWRRKVFPFYKIRRADKKASSPMDWDLVHRAIEEIRIEFDIAMPYKVVCLDDCEGDDIIGALVLHRHKTFKDEIGSRFDNKTLIVSADRDFLQLQRLQGVDQYWSQQNKFIRSDEPEIEFFTKVIKGDSGDDVPSSISQDDIFMIEQRQKSITQKKLDEWIPMLKEGVVPEELVYYDRNLKLISLFEIPQEIREKVVDLYNTANVASKSKMTEYFTTHSLGNFMDNLHLF